MKTERGDFRKKFTSQLQLVKTAWFTHLSVNIDSSSHEVKASAHYKENWIVRSSWELRWSSRFDCRRVDINVHDESRSRENFVTLPSAPDSLMSGEMGKIWTLHSIFCDEIQKWEAFSATPPVRLGVGQDDQKMPKNVKELPPSCKLTWFRKEYAVKQRFFHVPEVDRFIIIGTIDQGIVSSKSEEKRNVMMWWSASYIHVELGRLGGSHSQSWLGPPSSLSAQYTA